MQEKLTLTNWNIDLRIDIQNQLNCFKNIYVAFVLTLVNMLGLTLTHKSY